MGTCQESNSMRQERCIHCELHVASMLHWAAYILLVSSAQCLPLAACYDNLSVLLRVLTHGLTVEVDGVPVYRPGLLLEDFAGIPAAMAVLHKWFDADAIDDIVQQQPLFLVEDVEDAISSLNRFGDLQAPLT